MAEGLFREDLYFRLNVITVEMPPLRSRNGDFDLAFAEQHYEKVFHGNSGGRKLEGFSPEAAACIRAYAWPWSKSLENYETPSNAPSFWPNAKNFFPKIFQLNCAVKIRPKTSGKGENLP